MSRELDGGPIRVLASPGGGGTDGNPYIDLLHQGLAALGVEVTPFDRRRLLAARGVVHVHWPAALVRWDSGPRAVADVVKVLAGWRSRAAVALGWCGPATTWSRTSCAAPPAPAVLRGVQPHGRPLDLADAGRRRGAAAAVPGARPSADARRSARLYRDAYRASAEQQGDRRAADRALDLPPARRSYLLLGQIRPYKHVPALLRAFAADADPDARLLVVGEVRGDQHLADAARAAAPSGAVLRLERVPGAQIPLWHAAADVVVLPYDTRSALNSGALLLALSLDTPVVVADSPINRELRRQVGADWVHLFDGDPLRRSPSRSALRTPGGPVGPTSTPSPGRRSPRRPRRPTATCSASSPPPTTRSSPHDPVPPNCLGALAVLVVALCAACTAQGPAPATSSAPAMPTAEPSASAPRRARPPTRTPSAPAVSGARASPRRRPRPTPGRWSTTSSRRSPTATTASPRSTRTATTATSTSRRRRRRRSTWGSPTARARRPSLGPHR